MESNFGLILLVQVSKNKDKFLGLLRRNGVLVNSNVSNQELTNMVLKAMQKSETFKRETILLMSVLMSESNDGNFANMGGSSFSSSSPFSGLPTFDPNAFSSSSSSTSTSTTQPKKEFADTTVGKVTNQLFGAFDKFLQNKELDVRKVEAQAGQVIATTQGGSSSTPPPKSNTGLYVALGLGGVVVVGLLIYLVAKKK